MSDDFSGPVTVAEVCDVVARLGGMRDRAAENGQPMFHFVLAMAAESLADNLEVAGEGDGDAASHE